MAFAASVAGEQLSEWFIRDTGVADTGDAMIVSGESAWSIGAAVGAGVSAADGASAEGACAFSPKQPRGPRREPPPHPTGAGPREVRTYRGQPPNRRSEIFSKR